MRGPGWMVNDNNGKKGGLKREDLGMGLSQRFTRLPLQSNGIVRVHLVVDS